MHIRYSAGNRAMEIQMAIRDVQRDGIKVGIKTKDDGKVSL